MPQTQRLQLTVSADAKQPKVGLIEINGIIGKEGMFFWEEDVFSANKLNQALNDLGEVDTLDIRINSDGGSVFEGLAIYNRLKAHPAKKIVTIESIAASMAGLIAMVADELVMHESSWLMIHNPRGGVMGEAKDVYAYGDYLKKIQGNLRAIYEAKSGLDATKVQAMMDETTWLDGAAAVANGFATKIIPNVGNAFACIDPSVLNAFENVPEQLLALCAKGTNPTAEFTPSQTERKETLSVMDLTTLKAQHPTLVEAIRAEESARWLTCLEIAGNQPLAFIKAKVHDAKASAGDLAIEVLKQERANPKEQPDKQDALASYLSQAQTIIPTSANQPPATTEIKKEQPTEPRPVEAKKAAAFDEYHASTELQALHDGWSAYYYSKKSSR
jgi:ATP-dependent protease ClpP protease subunit